MKSVSSCDSWGNGQILAAILNPLSTGYLASSENVPRRLTNRKMERIKVWKRINLPRIGLPQKICQMAGWLAGWNASLRNPHFPNWFSCGLENTFKCRCELFSVLLVVIPKKMEKPAPKAKFFSRIFWILLMILTNRSVQLQSSNALMSF